MDLLHILASPVAVFLFASLLVVLAVGTAVWWGRVCAGLIAPLRAARAIVEGTPDPLSFGTDFPTINEQVAQTLSVRAPLARAWERLGEKMVREALPNRGFLMQAEQPPENFFSAPDLLRAEPVHWFRSLPNYLIGLGLCFTFIGVTLVIQNASLALALPVGPETQTAALRELLHAASFKFITSLFGILCSITYSFWYRWQSLRLDREIADFVAILESRLQVWRSGVLLHRALKEQQMQNGWLSAICATLGENATARVEDGIGRLATEVESFFARLKEQLADSNQQGVERLLELTMQGMNRSLEAQVQNIGTALESIHDRLSKLVDSFTDLSTTFAGVNTHLSATQDHASEQGRLLGISMRNAADSAGAVREAFASAHDGVARLAELPAAVESTVTLWDSLSKRIQTVAGEQTEAATKMELTTGALKTLWQDQSGHLAGADAALAATVSGLQAVFDRYTATLHGYTADLDAHLAKALHGLEHCVRQMNECPEQLRAAAADVRRAVVEGMSGLEKLPVDRIDALSRSLTEAANALAASWSAIDRAPAARASSHAIPPGPTRDGLLVP